MHKITHIYMSRHIRRFAEKATGYHINLMGFLCGNLIPDLSVHYLKIPHYYDKSAHFIMKSIHDLSNEQLSSETFSYAIQLGIISHYITDYFCTAHSSHYKGNCISHYMYEVLMILYLGKATRHIRGDVSKKVFLYYRVGDSILYIMRKAHARFIKDKSSLLGDVVEACKMASQTICIILNCCTSSNSGEEFYDLPIAENSI